MQVLEKALANIAPGTPAPQRGVGAFDYTHVLEDKHHETMPGANITVKWIPGNSEVDPDPAGWLVAQLRDAGGKVMGTVHSDVYGKDPDGRKFVAIASSEARGAPRESGKGQKLYWGRKLYEATLAHAKNHLGATHVGGGAHSSYASLAHRWLSDRHGMLYDPTPNIKGQVEINDPVLQEFDPGSPHHEDTWGEDTQAPESFDERYAPYAYTLKSELSKAEDLSAVPTGEQVEPAYNIFGQRPFGDFFDYDHLLSKEARDKKYHLELQVSPEGSLTEGSLRARVYTKGMNTMDGVSVVEASMVDPSTLCIHHSRTDSNHRGLHLGRAAYEAIMAHAKNNHGAMEVVGDEHSSTADTTHKAIANKYGLIWGQRPEPREPFTDESHATGSFDYAHGPYSLKLHSLVSDGEFSIPLAKEEDRNDPIIARLHQARLGWQTTGEVEAILNEQGVTPQHIAAATRIFTYSGSEYLEAIANNRNFNMDVMKSLVDGAGENREAAKGASRMMEYLSLRPEMPLVAQNADALVKEMGRLSQIQEEKHPTTDKHEKEVRAIVDTAAIKVINAHAANISDDGMAVPKLDHAAGSRVTRNAYLHTLQAKYGNAIPTQLQEKVLTYAKKLCSSLEKSTALHRGTGGRVVRETEAVMPRLKEIITGQPLPDSALKGRAGKNLFTALLTTAPNFPKKKAVALLDHFTGTESKSGSGNSISRKLMTGALMSSPHFTDAHWAGMLANFPDSLPMEEIIASPRFTDDIAKTLWTRNRDSNFVEQLKNAGKLTPEFADFMVDSLIPDPTAELAKQNAAIAEAITRTQDPASTYKMREGVVVDQFGRLHHAYNSNPYMYASPPEHVMDALGEKFTTAHLLKFMDAHQKLVNYRPDGVTLPPNRVLGHDEYSAAHKLQMPFVNWFRFATDHNIFTPEIQQRMAQSFVQSPPLDAYDSRRFLNGLNDDVAIHHLLSNTGRLDAIDHILSRPDAKPEWVAAVEARPDYNTEPPATDMRYFHPDHPRDGRQNYLNGARDVPAKLKKYVFMSPGLTSDRIAALVSGAPDYNSLASVITHPKFGPEHIAGVLAMQPTVYGPSRGWDAQGREIKDVLAPGTVPWSKDVHINAIKKMLDNHSSKFSPENWMQMMNSGYLIGDQHNPTTIGNIKNALSMGGKMPPEVVQYVHDHNNTENVGPYYTHEIKGLALKHGNAPISLLQSVIDRPWGNHADLFGQFNNLLERRNIPPEILNRMIEKVREVLPEVPEDTLGQPVVNHGYGTPQALAHNFWNQLMATHHAPDAWVEDVHRKMVESNSRLRAAGSGWDWKTDSTLGGRVATAMAERNPDTAYNTQVAVKVGSHIYRRLRDEIEAAGGQMHLSQIQSNPLFNKLNLEKARVMREMTPEELARIPEKNRPKVPVKKKTDYISSQGVQSIIDAIPEQKYNISSRSYTGAQMHDPRTPDKVFQVNLTTDHLRRIKEAGLTHIYKKMRSILRGNFGGHPMTQHGLGWIRHGEVTAMPSINIDEIQSDIRPPGGSWVAAKKGALERGWKGQAINYVIKNGVWNEPGGQGSGYDFPAEEMDKLMEILWGKGNDPHETMVEGLHQHLRNQGQHTTKVFYPDIGIQGTMRYGWDNIPPETPMPITDGNPWGARPPPEHMVETHIKTPEKMGYDMRSAKYGDEPTHVTESRKGWPYHTSPVRKFEDVIKGIETLPTLPLSHVAAGDRIYEATHYLTAEHRKLGYTMQIRSGNGQFGPYSMADVRHGGNIIGGASMYISDQTMKNDEKRKYAQFDMVGLKDQHVGKKLGLPMYEALLASAKGHHGATHVRGLAHSSMAHSVHQKLAEKHGLKYAAEPNFPSSKYANKLAWESKPSGKMDGKWGPYSYTL